MVLVCSYVVVRVFLGVSMALVYGCYGVLDSCWVFGGYFPKFKVIQYIVVISLVKMECAVLNYIFECTLVMYFKCQKYIIKTVFANYINEMKANLSVPFHVYISYTLIYFSNTLKIHFVIMSNEKYILSKC